MSKIKKQIIWSLLMSCLALIVTVSSTYAWFTVNRQVSTGRVSARAAEEDLKLLLCGTENGEFSETTAVITQVNVQAMDKLMPVSTADLKSFCELLYTDGQEVNRYSLVEREENLYHGRIYIRPTTVNLQTGGRMALYFDQTEAAGGKLMTDVEGALSTAGRLGLSFQTAQREGYIFYLTPPGADEKPVVVSYDETNGFREVGDPAVSVNTYEIQVRDTEVVLPEKPLAILELDKPCALDIYFYLEGCDVDCTEEISGDSIDLHMAFYGVLVE